MTDDYGYDPDAERIWLELAVLITQGRVYGKFDGEGFVIYIATIHGGLEDALPIETIARAECWPVDWRAQVAAFMRGVI